jgi:sterol desaturase/sphingolipid hydroxylase (fatty acid hydroxylase superfamily)
VQGLVSHFNVDSRVGWVNRVLVGTELHRWHHAAGVNGNYAAALSIWDQLFGSFVYRPGVEPDRLGVEEPNSLPADTEIVQVLLEPLGRARGHAA